MSLFGVKGNEFGGGTELYVGEDERLWEWLISEDLGELSGDHYRVPAPEGYVWLPNSYKFVLVEDTDEAPSLVKLSCGSSHNDKALALFNTLRHVDNIEFYSLKIPEDRCIHSMIY